MSHADLVHVLSSRGYLHQCTDSEALSKASAEQLTAYIGFDCTAKSLHIGNLVQIMMLRWIQKAGHRPIALLGGGTTKIGDPSGKDSARKMLTDADIAENKEGIRANLAHFISFEDGALLLDNSEWLDDLNYIAFLRDYGVHFSVNRMLTQDSVRLRLEREQSLSFLEFNYMILQAYDYYELAKRYDCRLQLGGSDQWGNIVMGADLTRRLLQKSVFGFTSPLITTASGAKMGKSVSGSVWLNGDMCSPYDYWQYWRNVEDADVGRFLKLFTELPLEEIAKLEALQGSEINEAKKILAHEATRLCHGEQAAQESKATAERVFEQGGLGASLPVVEVRRDLLTQGVSILDLMRDAGFSESNSETRRHIRAGAVKLKDMPIQDEAFILKNTDFEGEDQVKFSLGKKKHVIIKLKE